MCGVADMRAAMVIKDTCIGAELMSSQEGSWRQRQRPLVLHSPETTPTDSHTVHP